MKIQSVNPATEQVNKEFEVFDKSKALEICRLSKNAFPEWAALDVKERESYMRKLAAVLRKKSRKYAESMTIEMGKPIKQSLAEIEKCAWTAEIYAENSEKWLESEEVKTDARKSYIAHQPLGLILGIMPWNFPFWQALRFAIPAMSAGNAAVLRHSNVVPICALDIESAFREAGFPENVFRTIITDHDTVNALIKSDFVDGVSLTGSVEAGSKVAAVAGKNIKKFVLELGGSDPFVVLEDADIALACAKAVEGRTINTGQSCISSKRFIVVKRVAEEFIIGFAELMKDKKTGDPMLESTDIGPLANKAQLEKLEDQVKRALSKGAVARAGGKRLNRKGYFFEPSVIANVKKSSPLFKEEVFGPVAPVTIVKNEEEAIIAANNSQFGLGASIWTEDYEKGERLASRLEAGTVAVNSIVRSDPRLPFGGIKRSGIGRELSRYGLLEFTNVKSVIIR